MSDIAREAAEKIGRVGTSSWCGKPKDEIESIIQRSLDASTTEKDREIERLENQCLAFTEQLIVAGQHLADCRRALEEISKYTLIPVGGSETPTDEARIAAKCLAALPAEPVTEPKE